MPDYEAGINIPSNDYIAPKNGIVVLVCSGNPIGGRTIYVNGQGISYFAEPSYPMDSGFWALVKAGDVITFVTKGSKVTRTFYPMRAA